MAEILAGTDLKFRVRIKADGFLMKTHPWQVRVEGNGVEKVFSRANSTEKDDGYEIAIRTDDMGGAGVYWAVTEIDVPDDAFESGYRHEVYKRKLCDVNRL